MPFNVSTGVYTAAAGATNAATGQVIQSAAWNSVHTDFQTALTTLGTLVIPGNSGGVWTSYSLVVSALGTGTLTTVGGTTARFYQLGKATFLQAQASITTATGTIGIIFSLPTVVSAGGRLALFGREDGVSNKMLVGFTGTVGTGSVAIVNYDNSNCAVSGAVIRIGGTYESA
ncbi:MAG TPA: hypothetical protein VGT08_01720 [Terracidiphilus sp.]|nr:hypothetical protein [Terracidiphilus sp.]